ncbi:MAG: Phosphoenolpyruvate synthase [Verrucomicrobia subdivision 3 bacterium]|nr:Phosphoenolpyruvate synthase [Limisphaerales bacterium]MCS1416712.1 Phosphoenolpyruvate synthase [Limisphaerales bacterium]
MRSTSKKLGLIALLLGNSLFYWGTNIQSQPAMSGPPPGRPGDPGVGDSSFGGFGGFGRSRGGFGNFLRMDPLFAAIDRDKDGELSRAEIAGASSALRFVDKNNDGMISSEETRLNFRGRGGFGFGQVGGEAVEQQDPEEVKFGDGVAVIPDRATFKKLAYQGSEVLIDRHLDSQEFVKFQIEGVGSDDPKLYFINTITHRAHMMFMRAVGISMRGFGRGDSGQMRGVLVYRPLTKAPNGSTGLYTYEFEPNDSFPYAQVKFAYGMLVEKMPLLKGKLGYYPMPGAMSRYREEKSLYEAGDLPVYLDEDLFGKIAFLPLNVGESFGRLRVMRLDERPNPRDVVIYDTLPNEMPRVAGIITGARQTPLSHVNLRAVQDKIPNAFLADGSKNAAVQLLVGKNIFYKVTSDGYEIREASAAEVEAHFAGIRPTEPQTPQRDLSVKRIRSFAEIGFDDAKSVGVKAANLATMRRFEFDAFTVPDGFAVPFAFYDGFMKHNQLYAKAAALLARSDFKNDREARIKGLKKFRKAVCEGEMPAWMMVVLGELQRSFPEGTPIRVRSSTNNEDLPGFSGAGLYSSYTHHPHEGHLAKSIKQVFASLWNFRTFEEREFYRINHFASAMGVLVHPNYQGERANGVAVTDDILYQTYGNYYVNVQVGEDLVTNPEVASVPEELLISWWDAADTKVMRSSNKTADGAQILNDEHLQELSDCLQKIHREFRDLYGKTPEDRFAMEIEFKVTRDSHLAIKQARPWVF